MHVQLYPIGLQLERAEKGGKGVFGALAWRAAMPDQQRSRASGHSAMRWTIMAIPCPTPMHIVASP